MKPKILSAGIVPYSKLGSKILFLVLRSYNYWDFPKGLVEDGENPLDSAVRELAEETGLDEVRIQDKKSFYETEVYAAGKVARYYLGEVRTRDVVLGINPELGRPEHNEFRWVTADEAKTLLGNRVQKALDWAQAQLKKEKGGL